MLQACKETTHQKKGQPDAGKEYAQADSRYASRDSFTICMEAVTAFVEGPLCFVIMYGMLKQKPWRFTLQLAVSLGQMYGDVLYFATTCYEGTATAAVPTADLRHRHACIRAAPVGA